MIYFDNAATTYKKPKEVYKAISDFFRSAQANPGRSSHRLSLNASELVYDAREEICRLLNYSFPEQVVFTYNATYALNIAIKSLIDSPCHVITSDMEHNSVIRVLEGLKLKYGIEYSRFSAKNLSYESLKKLLRSDTRLIVSTMASNVSGLKIDEGILSSFARDHNIKLILDASQAIGHRRIDLSKTPAYAICAPGHKALFGLMGSGFAVFGERERGLSLIEGGSGSNSRSLDMPLLLPEGYEAGTLGVPSIAALSKGVRFVREYGEQAIEGRLDSMTKELYQELKNIPDAEILGYGSGILSFNLKAFAPDRLSYLLDREGICVRGGLHCSPEAHSVYGTEKTGAVRASFSVFNERKEIKSFLDKLNRIRKQA